MTADEYNRLLLQGIVSGKGREVKREGRKKENPKVPTASETEIQKGCIQWFRSQHREIWEKGKLIHIANERQCSMRRGKELKDMGVRKGIPDLQLFVARKGYHGLLIEMKRPNEYPRPEQRELMKNLSEEGYLCKVCKSLEEFITIINDYLN